LLTTFGVCKANWAFDDSLNLTLRFSCGLGKEKLFAFGPLRVAVLHERGYTNSGERQTEQYRQKCEKFKCD